ncbi:hypothetical protein [Actinomadura sp. 6N118]|uniref:hypothetical protein n=1 Tax=Actinomadura sp. 6N118 TaxID=3375151 RepID=UPI00379FFD41
MDGAGNCDPLTNPQCGIPDDLNGPQEAPQVTPQQLAQRALAQLRLPVPAAKTAPPRGKQGVVFLPHWVWVPASQWRPITKRASQGSVWVEVIATPQKITIQPGAGQPGVECAGPGTAYHPGKPASAQRTDCSHTYLQSSALQPGGTYTMTVSVEWTATWRGAGGLGGSLPPLSMSTSFGVRVAEGQSLN